MLRSSLALLSALLILCSPCWADVVLLRGEEELASIPTQEREGVFFVSAEDLLRALGGQFRASDEALEGRVLSRRLKLLAGASAFVLDGRLCPLPGEVVREGGFFLLDLRSARSLLRAMRSDLALRPRVEASSPSPPPEGGSGGGISVRCSSVDGFSRVVFELPEGASAEHRLEGGAMVLSFGGVGAPPPLSEVKSLPGVKSLSADLSDGRLKVRLLLEEGVRARAFQLPSPRRLVVDLSGVRSGEDGDRRPAGGVAAELVGRPGGYPRGQRVVAVDPGHGGRDPGAIGAGGVKEKDVNLAVALLLERELSRRGVRVVMTRRDDRYLSLAERRDVANAARADLFVSLHCNALPPGRRGEGFEVYLMSLPTDRDAMELALIENKEVGNGGAVEERTNMLMRILGDMQQNAKISESIRLAELFVQRMRRAGINAVRVAQAPFFVLRGAAMPAFLLEMGYITNPVEAQRLASPGYQAALASAMADAILACLEALPEEWR